MVKNADTCPDAVTDRLYGLIGYPLGHSFSQIYFSEKFAEERKNGVSDNMKYRLFPLPSLTGFQNLIESHPRLFGLNVTIPYKERIIGSLDELSDEALNIGAVNVIRIYRDESGRILKLKGYNSDSYGFGKSLAPLLRHDIRRAFVLGTGGASKAVLYALRQFGIDATPVSRNPGEGVIGYDDLSKDVIMRNLLIVNCTPLGTYPDVSSAPDIPYHMLTPRHICYDLVYNPDITEFMRRSAVSGAVVKNGLEMLHLQADKAWEIWNE